MEILTHYILPNIALFGSIYLFAKAMEADVWYGICNYNNLVKG